MLTVIKRGKSYGYKRFMCNLMTILRNILTILTIGTTFQLFGQTIVKNTTFIDWTGEGPVAIKIIEQNKIDSMTYKFKLTGIYNHYRKIIIHIIELKKGIAVFEKITNGTGKSYYLMIAADKIKSVPIIENYCTTQKLTELQFDEPNFKSLLTTKRQERLHIKRVLLQTG